MSMPIINEKVIVIDMEGMFEQPVYKEVTVLWTDNNNDWNEERFGVDDYVKDFMGDNCCIFYASDYQKGWFKLEDKLPILHQHIKQLLET